MASTDHTDLTDPARNDSAAVVMKKHRTPALRGANWDLLTAVVATSEQKNWKLAQDIEDQMYLATALGKYLDRQAAHYGKKRPDGVGMSDDPFRDLVTAITAGQVTPEAFLAVLEIFYGLDATHAHIFSVAEPFAIEEGSTLSLKLDGKTTVEAVFHQEDFGNAAAGRAIEVAAVLNRNFRQAGVSAFATPWLDPQNNATYVAIYTGSPGLRGSVAVTAGTAQHWLRFPRFCPASIVPEQRWQVSHVGLRTRFTTPLSFLWAGSVRVGDYVLVRDPAFASGNHGSFKVLDLRWSAVSGEAYFEVENSASVVENVLLTVSNGIEFFRATPASLLTQPRSSYLTQAPGKAEAVLPATASVVQRQPGKAAYLRSQEPLVLVSGTLDTATGIVTLVTAIAHGFSVGDQVIVEGLMFNTGDGYNASPNGAFTVTDVPTPLSFSYTLIPPLERPAPDLPPPPPPPPLPE